MNYDYGNKRQWRRWVWNRIAERTNDRANQIVLFLAAENAEDIQYAERVGFRSRNMIAVEKDRQVIKTLRDLGVLTIEGELCEVMTNWPKLKTVSIVHADFCCGLNASVLSGFIEATGLPAFADSVFSVNLLRGRDPSTNQERARFKSVQVQGVNPLHRGVHLYTYAIYKNFLQDSEALTAKEFIKVAEGIETISRIAFNSYRSTAGSQVFDSVVWKNPLKEMASFISAAKSIIDCGKKTPFAGDGMDQRRRIAAVLAHHTRRAA